MGDASDESHALFFTGVCEMRASDAMGPQRGGDLQLNASRSFLRRTTSTDLDRSTYTARASGALTGKMTPMPTASLGYCER